MSTENKKSRWNRFEIAFNERNWPEKAALRNAWREKSDKTGGLVEMDKAAGSTQERGQDVDAKTFAEEAASKKRSFDVAPSFGERARRAEADAEAKNRADPARKSSLKSPLKSPLKPTQKPTQKLVKSAKSGKSVKLIKLIKLTKAASFNKSTLATKEFPFPRRPRTFRSSEPPRRFDDPRKD